MSSYFPYNKSHRIKKESLNFKIRKAQLSEAELLSNLALRSKAYWGYSAEFIDACRSELTYSQEELRNNHFFVAEMENLIIGFYALEVLSTTAIELLALFIDPAYINQGYGRKLIAHAKFIARKLDYKVIVIQGDPNAKNFYLKVGGKLTGERKSASIQERYLPTFVIELDEVDN